MVLDTLSAVEFSAFVGLIGLLVGSFLNVVIYRLPIMMRRDWWNECLEYLRTTLPDKVQHANDNNSSEHLQQALDHIVLHDSSTALQEQPFNLVLPLSRCSACKTEIKPYQNIPVISYIVLKGRCGQCRQPISMRYPAIEVFTFLVSVVIAWHFGCTMQTLAALILSWSLIALSFIDIDEQLLPDSITLPVLWLGLLLSLFDVFADTYASIIGAVAGYLVLWSVYHLFKLATGKEGMGYGDFKLLALLGAWLGWQYLPVIILLSSLVGAIIGSLLIILGGRDRNLAIPFGPYLAAAGFIALLWGKQINQLYLSVVGL
jgi:leader peptidase (prepilin peptidase) / N-methyltransferase